MSQPPKQPNTSRGPTLQQTDSSQEEAPTQRIPRVQMPKPQSSTQADGGQDYRTRVEQAELPDNVRKAALREVSKLERTSNQSPESGYIRTWLDTVLGLPWTTKTADSTGNQPAHEVDPAAANIEKAAEKKADPPAAVTEKVAGKNLDPAANGPPKAAQEKAELAAAGAEKVDIAPAEPKDDDTIEIPAVPAATSRGRQPRKPGKQQAKQEPPAAVSQKAAREKAEPTAAVTQKAAQEKAESAATATEQANTAHAGPRDDDTIEIPAVRAVPSRGRHPQQLSNQQAKQEPPTADLQKTAETKADPAATSPQKTAEEKVDPAAADTEKANTAPASPKDDDTVEMPAVRAVTTRHRHPQKRSKQQAKQERLAARSQKAAQTMAGLAATDAQKTAQTKAELAAADTHEVTGENLDPAATATQKDDQEKEEAAAARAEKADIAPAGPKEDDTLEVPAVGVVPSGGRTPQNLSKQQGKVEPEATDPQKAVQTEATPAATDPSKTAQTKAVAPATDSNKAATAPPAANGVQHASPQLPGQQVIGPVPVETTPKKKQFRWLALAATVLAALLIGALLFSASRDRGVTAEPVPTASAASSVTSSAASPTVNSPTSEPSDESAESGGGEPTIQLEDLAGSARAYEPVRIEGVYRGGADTFVRVQRREEGKWVFFPLPTRTDTSGRFTAYVELGPGRHRLRIMDPRTGVKSEPFVLVVKG